VQTLYSIYPAATARKRKWRTSAALSRGRVYANIEKLHQSWAGLLEMLICDLWILYKKGVGGFLPL